jgi:hypothetical protein
VEAREAVRVAAVAPLQSEQRPKSPERGQSARKKAVAPRAQQSPVRGKAALKRPPVKGRAAKGTAIKVAEAIGRGAAIVVNAIDSLTGTKRR